MSRFRGPVVLVALLPFFAGATQGEPSDAHASDERPNILFVFSDDQIGRAHV